MTKLIAILILSVYLINLISISYSVGILGSLTDVVGKTVKKTISHLAGENLSEVTKQVGHLKSWAQNQKGLNSRTSDDFLATFLRSANYNVEEAQKKIDTYYRVRSAAPDVFKNRNIFKNRKLRILAKLGLFMIVPANGDEAPIAINRLGIYDPKKTTFDDHGYFMSLAYEAHAWDSQNSAITGMSVIADCANMTLEHVAQYTPELLQKYVLVNLNGNPLQMKEMHFINTPPFMESTINLLKRIMDENMQSIVHTHTDDLTTLYEFIPKNRLPKEYGGSNGSIKTLIKDCERVLEKYANYYENDKKFGLTKIVNKGLETVSNVANSILSLL